MIVSSQQSPEGWDAFVTRSTNPNEFLQSWAWGVFQEKAGKHIFRAVVQNDEAICAVAHFVPHTTRLGQSFLLAPRGPIIDPALSLDERVAVWKELLRYITENLPPKTMFLKVEPNVLPDPALKFEPGTGMHPEQTLLIDLTQSEEQLLAGMHQKTRYNIRLAERRGVSVRFSRSPDDVKLFLVMLKQTAQRQGIGIFPESYYHTMIDSMGDSMWVAIASHESTPLAGALLVRFGNTLTYLHGASSDTHQEHMSPHLLQWRSMQRGRELGCSWYDFYGIAPEGETNHRWAGITRFKQGFGGQVFKYPGAFNIIYQRSWYLAYRFAKKLTGR